MRGALLLTIALLLAGMQALHELQLVAIVGSGEHLIEHGAAHVVLSSPLFGLALSALEQGALPLAVLLATALVTVGARAADARVTAWLCRRLIIWKLPETLVCWPV